MGEANPGGAFGKASSVEKLDAAKMVAQVLYARTKQHTGSILWILALANSDLALFEIDVSRAKP